MVDDSTTTMNVANSEMLAALSQAFSYPLEGIGRTTEALRSLGEEAKRPFAALLDDAIAKSEAFESQTAAQLAYTRLFIGSMRMEAPPYPSYYLEEEHTLFGRAAVEVESIYRQFGIEVDPKEIAPPDHLRYLLAFLSLLARRFEETGDGAFAEAYADFCNYYIFTWIDDCRKLVDLNAEEPYYPALMALIIAVLRNEGGASGAPTGD